jgi:hypothetical protein
MARKLRAKEVYAVMKGRLWFLVLAVSMFLLLAGGAHLYFNKTVAADGSQTQLLSLVAPPPFNVCKGTFANCTKAPCNPVIKTVDGKQTMEFACSCEVQTNSYSAGPYDLNLNSKDQCQGVTKDAPYPGQKVLSRYSPIKSYVACTNHRAWAWCLNMPCKVNPNSTNSSVTATCACQVATGEPYIAVPPDGQYSQAACNDIYVSSATIQDVLHVTEFLTTPAGKDLRPSQITLLVPTPTPTPSPGP